MTWHPNIDTRSFVCADVLAAEWSAACSVAPLLLAVQSLLASPTVEHPANLEAWRRAALNPVPGLQPSKYYGRN